MCACGIGRDAQEAAHILRRQAIWEINKSESETNCTTLQKTGRGNKQFAAETAAITGDSKSDANTVGGKNLPTNVFPMVGAVPLSEASNGQNLAITKHALSASMTSPIWRSQTKSRPTYLSRPSSATRCIAGRMLYELEFGKAKAIGAQAANIAMGKGDANAIIADAYTTKAAELSGKSERHIQEAATG